MLPRVVEAGFEVHSDASGAWGCGAYWGSRWLWWEWQGPSVSWDISAKELLPILYALVMWGSHWRGRVVVFHCDNMAVVSVVNTGSSRDSTLMHMLRCLFFVAAKFEVQVRAQHIPGIMNVAADALSRNNLPHFLQVVHQADPDPSPMPAALVDLLVREQPDWTSPHWARLFNASLRPA